MSMWSHKAFLACAAALLTATLGACAPASSATDAPAHKSQTEGTLTWYTDDDAQEVASVIQAFTAETGIEVVLLATEFVAQRLEAEKSSGAATADVISFAGAPNVLRLEEAGLLAPLPSSVSESLPEQGEVFVSGSGNWFSNQASSWGVFYNTDLVDEAHAPTDFTSFLDPYWNGKFNIPISTNDSSIEGYYQIAHEPSLGKSFLTALGANQPVISSSSGQQVNDVVVGNQLGGIANDNAVWQQIARGAPLAFTYPPQGTTFSQKYNGLVDAAAHPKAAEAFLNFLITPEAARMLSEGTGKLSTFPGIPASPDGRPTIEEGVFFPLPDPHDLLAAQAEMAPFLKRALQE